jgi:cell fate regulator YaaT (PSP1 superfamily)
MSCGSCGTSTKDGGVPAGCNSNGNCGTESGCNNKLNVFDWLSNMDLPHGQTEFDIVEVRFKNSRKDFYKNESGLTLHQGDIVAVEASPGHDVGVVSVTGELVRMQLKKKNIEQDTVVAKVYRKAKPSDIEKWHQAQKLEETTMFKARKLALELGLRMKISDVEFQGDKSKAMFYYTADERVDFRELIKVMAQQFYVRVEMKQIGARQEASRLGGIGSCGRELCCSTWLTDFRTVNTSAARYQQLSLNPLKLAGQCGKLKCCLNFELDSYVDALKDFPDNTVRLKTKKGEAFHQKSDIFKRKMWYSYTSEPGVFIEFSTTYVKEVLDFNKQGVLPEELVSDVIEVATNKAVATAETSFSNVVGQDSVNRFDDRKKANNRNNSTRNKNNKPRGERTAPGATAKTEVVSGDGTEVTSTEKPTTNPRNNSKNNNNRNNNNRNKPRVPSDAATINDTAKSTTSTDAVTVSTTNDTNSKTDGDAPAANSNANRNRNNRGRNNNNRNKPRPNNNPTTPPTA